MHATYSYEIKTVKIKLNIYNNPKHISTFLNCIVIFKEIVYLNIYRMFNYSILLLFRICYNFICLTTRVDI